MFRLFRRRRDIRPNDYYLEQIVELDNDLRKERECGMARRIRLKGLDSIDDIPKPWHFEFWNGLPTDETLPFTLVPFDQSERLQQQKQRHRHQPTTGGVGGGGSNKSQRTSAILCSSKRQSQLSEWDYEWEYYSQSEDEENRSLYDYAED